MLIGTVRISGKSKVSLDPFFFIESEPKVSLVRASHARDPEILCPEIRVKVWKIAIVSGYLVSRVDDKLSQVIQG